MKRDLMVGIAVVLLVVSVSARAEEPRKIEFRMKPGESVNYALRAETTTDSVRHASSGTEKRRLDFKSDMRVVLRCVKATEDGVTQVEITYPDFAMESSVTEKGRTSRVVSDRSGARSYVDGKLQESATWNVLEKQGRPNLAKLFGSVIEFTLDKRGRVLDVKVPAGLSGQFSGIDVKQFFRQQVIFPEVAISPGTEWNETSERVVPEGPGPLGRKVVIDEVVYVYEKSETASGRECARIGIKVTSKPKEKIANLKEFTQTNEGWSLMALENGQQVSSEMRLFQEMKGTPGGIRTELKTTGVVRTNLVEPSAETGASPEKRAPEETK